MPAGKESFIVLISSKIAWFLPWIGNQSLTQIVNDHTTPTHPTIWSPKIVKYAGYCSCTCWIYSWRTCWGSPPPCTSFLYLMEQQMLSVPGNNYFCCKLQVKQLSHLRGAKSHFPPNCSDDRLYSKGVESISLKHCSETLLTNSNTQLIYWHSRHIPDELCMLMIWSTPWQWWPRDLLANNIITDFTMIW